VVSSIARNHLSVEIINLPGHTDGHFFSFDNLRFERIILS
jgi:hypothetical protein